MFGVPLYLWLLFLLSAALFILFPQIDLDTAALFYNGTFYLRENPLVQFFYHFGPLFALAVGLLSLVALVIGMLRHQERIFGIRRRVWSYLLLSLLIGPGLIVNLLFKEHWGRARPVQVTQFGGEKSFTPAFVVAHQCRHNCSFTCGHASSGFYFIAPALLERKRRRRRLYVSLAILFGLLIGLGRMAQGGHFLSDVVFSLFFVAIPTLMLYHYMFEKKHADIS